MVIYMSVNESNFEVSDSILIQNSGLLMNIETCHNLHTSGISRGNRKISENTTGLIVEGFGQWSAKSGPRPFCHSMQIKQSFFIFPYSDILSISLGSAIIFKLDSILI